MFPRPRLLAAALSAAFLYGCATKGAKVVEGVDFSAGIDLPAAEGAAELSFINYLSGFRFSADRNYGLWCEFDGTNYFSVAYGLYEGWGTKRFRAKCKPWWLSPTNGVPQTAREPKTQAEEPPPPDRAS